MRVAIVGCGLIGEKRTRAALAGGHRVIAVADLDNTRAERLAKVAGDAQPFTNWRAAIDADVDAVIVATVHNSLAEITVSALETGRHVLVEKPAARTAAELVPVLDAVRRTGRIVKVGFNHRFHPAITKAKEIVDQGSIGSLLFIRGRYGHGGRVGYEKEWRFVPELSGGGEMIDQGSHLIDLSRWFMGDFNRIFGVTPKYFWDSAVEDNCFLALQTASGQMAWLHATWTEWKNTFCFEIYGREGKLQIDGLGGSYGVEKLTYYKMLPEMGPPLTQCWEYPLQDRSWDLELAEFAAAIAEGRRPIGDIYDAKANLDIIARVYSNK